MIASLWRVDVRVERNGEYGEVVNDVPMQSRYPLTEQDVIAMTVNLLIQKYPELRGGQARGRAKQLA